MKRHKRKSRWWKPYHSSPSYTNYATEAMAGLLANGQHFHLKTKASKQRLVALSFDLAGMMVGEYWKRCNKNEGP